MLPTTWAWRRWIGPDEQDEWIARLEAAGCATWTTTNRPDRVQTLLAVYQEEKAAAVALRNQFGGRVKAVKASEWIAPGPVPPTRIGRKLEIIHEKARGQIEGEREVGRFQRTPADGARQRDDEHSQHVKQALAAVAGR